MYIGHSLPMLFASSFIAFVPFLCAHAAFNDASNPNVTWQGNSVHPTSADPNKWCYFPANNATQKTACDGTYSTNSEFQTLLYTHLNLPQGYSIAYYALDNLTLLGDRTFPVPTSGARLCLSGQAADKSYQTLCMTTHYDNNIAEAGTYCLVALGQSTMSDGCYTPITSALSLPATTITGSQPVSTPTSQQNIAKLNDCTTCNHNHCTFTNAVSACGFLFVILALEIICLLFY